jgi:hypothetical protein
LATGPSAGFDQRHPGYQGALPKPSALLYAHKPIRLSVAAFHREFPIAVKQPRPLAP